MGDNGSAHGATEGYKHPSLGAALDRFHLTIDALRDMSQSLIPLVRDRERERMGPEVVAKLGSLSPKQQTKLIEALADFRVRSVADQSGEGNDPSRASEEVKITTVAEVGPQERVRILASSDSADDIDAVAIQTTLDEVFQGDFHSIVSFAERTRRAANGPSLRVIMQHSIVAQGIAAFEALVAGVITQFYVQNPAKLEDGEKCFTLRDVREFGSLAEAEDAVLTARVRSAMKGGFSAWDEWFRSNCEATFESLSLSWPALNELIQRRHIVMHNGGQVSHQYVAKTSRSNGDPKPQVGATLPIDDNYVLRGLDELDVIGTALATSAWGTWRPSDRDTTAGIVLQRSYDLMLIQRWGAVARLSSLGVRMKCSSGLREPMRVNGWVARTELEGPASVHQEVRSWDVSAHAQRFRLVKLVLLDELDQAAALAPGLIARGDLRPGELKEWPVLRRLREYEGFDLATIAP